MRASWNGQIYKSEGKYSIQFETDNYNLYRYVEKACQDTMDICDVYNKPPSLENGGDMDAKFGLQMQGMRACDILPDDGGMEVPAVSAPGVLPRDDEKLLRESDDSGPGEKV